MALLVVEKIIMLTKWLNFKTWLSIKKIELDGLLIIKVKMLFTNKMFKDKILNTMLTDGKDLQNKIHSVFNTSNLVSRSILSISSLL